MILLRLLGSILFSSAILSTVLKLIPFISLTNVYGFSEIVFKVLCL